MFFRKIIFQTRNFVRFGKYAETHWLQHANHLPVDQHAAGMSTDKQHDDILKSDQPRNLEKKKRETDDE